MDIGCTLGITAVALGLSAMFYGYKLKTDKKSVDLVIKLQDRIINCEKSGHAPIKGGIPTPPPPPTKDGIKKPPHQQFNKQKPPQKGGWHEIHEAIKKRRKDL
ncbi:11781_t:CDS:2, partial [Ambispora leptoticha]